MPVREVVVLHHLLGVTDGVRAFAARAGALGVEVRVPDLLDGVVHADMASAVAHLELLGMDAVVARAGVALADLAPGAVLVGLSLGAVPAQRTAQLRGDCAGVVLVGACLPSDAFGPAWPSGTPVRVHAAADDPVFRDEGDRAAAEALVAEVPDAALRLHPGSGHLLTEEGSPDHDAVAVAAVLRDVDELVRA